MTKQRVFKCHVNGCENTQPPHKCYPFPTEKEKRDTWIEACMVEEQYLNLKLLYACQDHFRPEMMAKDRLKPMAFPSTFKWTNTDFTSYPPEEVCHNCSRFMSLEREFNVMKEKYENQLRQKNEEVDQLKNELELREQRAIEYYKNSVPILKNSSKDAVLFSKVIVNPQRVNYSDEEKVLLQNMNYVSSKFCNFMRDTLKFKIPARSTFYEWSPVKTLHPGINFVI